MTDPPIIFARSGDCAAITLNRPHAGNAIDFPLARSLARAAAKCREDVAIRSVILSGAGDCFCVGGDLGVIAGAGAVAPAIIAELTGELHRALSDLSRMEKPLVVLVNGPAAGAGFGLAALGDVVLATPRASFTTAFTRLGLSPDGGLTHTLARLVGVRNALELLFSNRTLPAVEALELGIVSAVVEAEELAARGAEWSRQLLGLPGRGAGVTRRLVLDSYYRSFDDQLESEVVAITALAASTAAQEAIEAFASRRGLAQPKTTSFPRRINLGK